MQLRYVILVATCFPLWGCGDDDDVGNVNTNNQNENQNTAVLCGDGVRAGAEECDFGTANSDTQPDACRTDCTLPVCGDGVTDLGSGEHCDEGAANSDTEPDACRSDCTLPACGDGVIDSDHGEACDAGAANADTPDAICRTDCQPRRCGDGVTDAGEQCDWGLYNSDALPNACRADCQEAYCGDGVTDDWEECDDGDNVSGDGCSADCGSDETCGNGIVDAGEECDAGAYNTLDPNAPCRPDCRVPSCGDGVVDDRSGETCDDGAANSDTVPNACRLSCQPARCGDGVTDAGETCDDQNTQAGDGCDARCWLEYGWNCAGAPDVCTPCPTYHHGAACGGCAVLVDVASVAAVADGASWPTAFRSVQEGIDQAHTVATGCEVWVARGSYYVFQGSALDTVALRDGVGVYGGFGGWETTRQQRDTQGNPSVLDGSDGLSMSYVNHVVSVVETLDATLDGLTIKNGRALGEDWDGYGGGVYVESSGLWLHDCLVTRNLATYDGGGLYSNRAAVEVSDSVFSGNTGRAGGGMGTFYPEPSTVARTVFSGNVSSSSGGGLFGAPGPVVDCAFVRNDAGFAAGGLTTASEVTRTLFIENRAGRGGGAELGDTAVLTDSVFAGNTATGMGGAAYMQARNPRFERCTFSGNVANQGGALYTAGRTTFTGTPRLTRCRFTGNRATEGGALYANRYSSPTLASCVLAGNEATYGGALYGFYGSIVLAGSTLAGNAAQWGRSLAGQYATLTAANSILWNGGSEFNLMSTTVRVAYSDVDRPTVQPGSGNILADPGFVADRAAPHRTGTWEDVTFDPSTLQTVLTDLDATFVPGALAGLYLQPEIGAVGHPEDADPRWFLIVDNTTQEIRIWGDLTSIPYTAYRYAVLDLRLRSDSVCIDAGYGCSAAGGCTLPSGTEQVPQTPVEDVAGAPRHDVLTVTQGGAGDPDFVDLGAYEYQE